MDTLLVARHLAMGASAIPLIGVTDPERFPDPWKALAALPRGAALIWRAYDTPPDAAALRSLSAAARTKNCLLLVAGYPQAALWTGTHGLHVPERSLARRYENGYLLSLSNLPPGLALTAACHSEKAILAASRAGADAVLISPVFPTASHPQADTLGIVRFARLARIARARGMTPYALGGIKTSADVRRLVGSGAAGIAGLSFLQF